MPKDRIEFAGSVPPQEAAQYLESIAKGLRERTMLLESGDSSITVEVSEDVKIEIKATSDAEKGKTSIDISVNWRQREQEEESAAPPGLLIVAGHAPAEATSFAE